PVFAVCYLGHGKGVPGDAKSSGDWVLSDGTVSMNDVLTLWRSSKAVKAGTERKGGRAHLYVYMDSCHSGAWVDAAAAMKPALEDVTIQASVKASIRAADSAFTWRFAACVDPSANTDRKVTTKADPKVMT